MCIDPALVVIAAGFLPLALWAVFEQQRELRRARRELEQARRD